jgi:hypothetical protein
METSLYNLYLLITTFKNAFKIVKMQINNTLILRNDNFAKLKQDKLKKAKLSAKLINTLLYKTPLIFNNSILYIKGNDIILI